jgi:hypothetical protein
VRCALGIELRARKTMMTTSRIRAQPEISGRKRTLFSDKTQHAQLFGSSRSMSAGAPGGGIRSARYCCTVIDVFNHTVRQR